MKQHNPFDQNNFSWLNKLKVTSTTMILNSKVEIKSEQNKKNNLEIVFRNFSTFSIGQISQKPFHLISIMFWTGTKVGVRFPDGHFVRFPDVAAYRRLPSRGRTPRYLRIQGRVIILIGNQDS